MKEHEDEKKLLMREHHSYIESLVTDGVILFGGPITEKPGGMLVVDQSSKDNVLELFNADPMIDKGLLEIEVNTWQIKHGLLK